MPCQVIKHAKKTNGNQIYFVCLELLVKIIQDDICNNIVACINTYITCQTKYNVSQSIKQQLIHGCPKLALKSRCLTILTAFTFFCLLVALQYSLLLSLQQVLLLLYKSARHSLISNYTHHAACFSLDNLGHKILEILCCKFLCDEGYLMQQQGVILLK